MSNETTDTDSALAPSVRRGFFLATSGLREGRYSGAANIRNNII